MNGRDCDADAVVLRDDRQSDVDRCVKAFLDGAAARPMSLTVNGESGAGKTTLVASISQTAQRRGFCVLTTMPAATESTLAYAGLADLLRTVSSAQLAKLPAPQRDALDWVLLSSPDHHGSTDDRAIYTGFLSVLNRLSDRGPTLVCIDDAQWLDPCTARAVSFAARRVTGRVGFVCTVRTELADGHTPLRVARPEDEAQLSVPPMSLGTMHTMIRHRLGLALPLPVLTNVHHVSAGNPFVALELARATQHAQDCELTLAGTLATIVETRIGGLSDDVNNVLLTTACAGNATVDTVRSASALNRAACDMALEIAEQAGILVISGDFLRFSHPLLAQGVISRAAAAERRETHRRLADVVTDPELQVLHVAQGTTGRDLAAVATLDLAADSARRSGAPATAAKLIELALHLGGDTPERRITLAKNIFQAGDPKTSRMILEDALRELPPGPVRGQAYNQLAIVHIFSDSFAEAADLLDRALAETHVEPDLRVKMLLSLAFARSSAGLLADGVAAATDAVTAAEAVGGPSLISQALGMRATLGFLIGEGIDEAAIERAVTLEGDTTGVPLTLRAGTQRMLLQAWSGRNPMAHKDIGRMCEELLLAGDEVGLFFAAFHAGRAEIWHGELAAAASRADDLLERAQLLGQDVPLFVAHSLRAWVDVYSGNERDCRQGIAAASAIGLRTGSRTPLGGMIPVLCFLEVSLGNYEAALTVLEPYIRELQNSPAATELITASFLPDAAEAAIAVGRESLADVIIGRLEANGTRLDRPWMLAVGARCRSMLQAARGDLDDALASIRRALDEHGRLPMPFERARSQLFYGQLLRRMRAKDAAAEELNAAIRTFEEIGTPVWAQRGHAELARVNVGPHRKSGLTPSEDRGRASGAGHDQP